MESSQKPQCKVSPVFIAVPLLHSGLLIWKARISFIFSLPLAIGVECQSPIFFPHPPTMLDMTDSLLGLPNSQIQHTPPCNREKYSLPFNGTVTRTALSTASKPRLYSFSFAIGFQLNRIKGTCLKSYSIFFNLFQLLSYLNFSFHQWEKLPVLNKTLRAPGKIGIR